MKPFLRHIFLPLLILVAACAAYAGVAAVVRGRPASVRRTPGQEAARLMVSRTPSSGEVVAGNAGTVLRVFREWETFDTRHGLPSSRVSAVLVDGERIWAGTDRGLAVTSGERWEVCREVTDPVFSMALCSITGDLWVGTARGLYRLTGGRLDHFTQFNSGLASDIVYGVTVVDGDVWAATAGGASRFIPVPGKWEIFSEKNSPMHEPWSYSICSGGGRVYVAVWGGGLLEYSLRGGFWKEYQDPDGDMEVDLFPDDGLIHNVTSSVSYAGGVVWVASYFGLSRYDGKQWKGYDRNRSGLASNFILSVKACRNGVWVGTDGGLNSFDGVNWVTYRRKGDGDVGGDLKVSRGTGSVSEENLVTGLPHNFVWGVDLRGDEIWVATDGGVGHGLHGTILPSGSSTP